jgi:hypothetical protein
MDLIAKVKTLDAGYDGEKQRMAEVGFKVGDEFKVTDVDMGSWSTSISLEGYPGTFNSVYFEFYEGDAEVDIYRDRRYNPYL